MAKIVPLDLKTLAGKRYWLALDESYEAEKPEFRAAEKPWMWQIPGRNGMHI
jgi:hypothetical protein